MHRLKPYEAEVNSGLLTYSQLLSFCGRRSNAFLFDVAFKASAEFFIRKFRIHLDRSKPNKFSVSSARWAHVQRDIRPGIMGIVKSDSYAARIERCFFDPRDISGRNVSSFPANAFAQLSFFHPPATFYSTMRDYEMEKRRFKRISRRRVQRVFVCLRVGKK